MTGAILFRNVFTATMRLATLGGFIVLTGPALAQHAPERWMLEEELRIGAIDGPQALSEVGAVLPSRSGDVVYVAQPQEHLIRVFDSSDGRLLRTIGRRGAGPGEFQRLSTLGLHGDSIYGTDMSLHRLSLFDPDGIHLRTERTMSDPLPETGRPARPVALTAAGDVIGESSVSLVAAARGLVLSSPLVVMDRSGTVIRTLGATSQGPHRSGVAMGPSRGVVFIQPLSNRSLRRVVPDGSAVIFIDQPEEAGGGAPFRVVKVLAVGDTAYDRRYRYAATPVTTQMADSIYRSFAELMGYEQNPRGAMRAAREHVRIPESVPPISGAVAGLDGTVWLRREGMGSHEAVWLVLDEWGRHRASVRAPADLTIEAVDGSTVWGVVRDELDVPYVVRYRTRSIQ